METLPTQPHSHWESRAITPRIWSYSNAIDGAKILLVSSLKISLNHSWSQSQRHCSVKLEIKKNVLNVIKRLIHVKIATVNLLDATREHNVSRCVSHQVQDICVTGRKIHQHVFKVIKET